MVIGGVNVLGASFNVTLPALCDSKAKVLGLTSRADQKIIFCGWSRSLFFAHKELGKWLGRTRQMPFRNVNLSFAIIRRPATAAAVKPLSGARRINLRLTSPTISIPAPAIDR